MSIDPDRLARLQELFEGAQARPPAARATWLAEQCEGDLALQCEVEGLLHQDSATQRIAVDGATIEAAVAGFAIESSTPTIEGLRLLAPLGAGAMGVVFAAEQDEPRRRIAVKIMRALPGARFRERFAREVDLLARLEHPNITRVHFAGRTTHGLPFLAMELVEGPTLSGWRERRSDRPRQLALIVKLCRAIEHAHQRGVLHRDLKPANILVAGGDEPKIVDFGIARLVDRTAEATALTDGKEILGTLPYMSPEQLDGQTAAIDTRTDIYALGVIAYELLTGVLPYDLAGKTVTEVVRILDREEAVPLGRRVPALRGDLEAIIAKAMAKDLDARYPTASAMLDDLERLARHEPVAAMPVSRFYLVRKFVRRHRVACLGVATVLVAVVGGVAATYTQYRRAEEHVLVAQASEARAQASLENFLLLRNVVQLDDARREAAGLPPDRPDRAPALRAWLERHGVPLQRRLPELERALARLRATRAMSQTHEQRMERRSLHARYPELQQLLTKRADWRIREAAVAGTEPVPEPGLDAATRALSAAELQALAWPLVDPWNIVWGRAPEALRMTRLALEKLDGGDTSLPRHTALGTLAWACLRCGMHQEALRHGETAARSAPLSERVRYKGYLDHLQRAIDSWPVGRAEKVADLEAQIAAVEAVVAAESDYVFADDGERFLYESLLRLVGSLQQFVGPEGELAAVRRRLAFVESVRQRSIDEHREAWRSAIETIAAEPRYGGLRIVPQVGLVPIGQDPQSRLYEFVHLASAAPEAAVTERDAASGRLRLSAATGIVFVLLPGATPLLGAQADDPQGANYDPAAHPNEITRAAALPPFLLGKHEVTRAQWARLWEGPADGRVPTASEQGRQFVGNPAPITELHPVDSVDWAMCARLL